MNAEIALKPLLTDLGGDRATVADLVRLFIEEAPKLLAEGRAAAQRKDAPVTQRAYHTLKGSAGQFGAQDVHEMAKDIEQAARSGTLPNEAAMGRIEKAWAAWAAAYKAWLDGAKAA